MWEGPFTWPKFDSPTAASFNLLSVDARGIYLWAFEYSDGYLIYAAGITRRPFRQRLLEHTRFFLNGTYTIFDLTDIQKGIRTEIWHGFWMKKRSQEKLKDYETRREEIDEAARKQLSAFRVFVAQTPLTPRFLERLEAAIMISLYSSAGPIAAIPDRGMMLAPRWQSEQPIVVRNTVPAKLHGLPEYLAI